MRLALVAALFVGCTAAPPQEPADASLPGDEGSVTPSDVLDAAAEKDGPPSGPAIELGDGEPFTAWSDGAPVIIVAGPQGGFHTEHTACVRDAGAAELHLAIVWGEVWRDELVMARAGWEFWQDQWEPDGDALCAELPPLVFDSRPEPGVAELRALLELADGRAATFAVTVDLVNP